MIHEAIATGATVDEARQNAINELGAPAGADVHTEVLTMPTKKILGLFGGSPAKARAFYETADEAKAPEAQKAAFKKADEPKKEQRKAPKAPKAPEKKAEEASASSPEEPKEKAKEEERIDFDISSSKSVSSAVEYLKAVLSGMGVSSIDAKAYSTNDNEIIIDLDCGEDYGIVIGRRGETLDSIQYLTRLVANKTKTENEYSRISVNIGNYREKRRNTLKTLARKNAEKVLKYGRNVTFEPMNPYERRIIHTTVQEIEGVTSHSVGSDNNRKVVITLAEGYKPQRPPRNGYNNRSKGGYKKGPRQSAPRPSQPSRAPRTDEGAKNVSLYGKIN